MRRQAEHIVVSWIVPILLIVLIPVGVTMYLNNEQREDSCKATITALEGITETAKAGVRDVVKIESLKGFTGEQLRFAVEQRRSTIAENERRAAVVKRMEKAIADLKASTFCQ